MWTGCLMEVSTMFHIFTYCVFTLWDSIDQIGSTPFQNYLTLYITALLLYVCYKKHNFNITKYSSFSVFFQVLVLFIEYYFAIIIDIIRPIIFSVMSAYQSRTYHFFSLTGNPPPKKNLQNSWDFLHS